jgi:N-acetylglucosaminyl-diphospho-decaprenol L-rhamnosyltransferase
MTAAQPLTSVIMVSYFTGPVLYEAIERVFAQTAPVELLLIDNGNPPEVTEKLKSIAAVSPRIKLFTGQGNIGFSRGCNMGAQMASGDMLLFLNPDSVIPSDTLTKLEPYKTKLVRPYMIGARLVGTDGKDQRGCRRALLTPLAAFVEALNLGAFFPQMRLNHHEDPIPTTATPIPVISGAFMYLPREDFWRAGGFDEGYFIHVDDLDFCLRYRRHGGEIYFVPEITVVHHGSTSQACNSFLERHKARGFVRYFHKNFGAEYPKPFLWLLDLAIWMRMGVRIAMETAKGR